MRKIIFFVLFLMLTGVLKAQESNEFLEKVRGIYGLNTHRTASSNEIEIVFANLGSEIYRRVQESLSRNQVELFFNSENKTAIAIFKFTDDPERFYAVKGILNEEIFIFEKELLAARQFSDENNGSILLNNGSEEIKIDITDGILTLSPSPDVEAKPYHGGTGFCQREPGEKFSDCYKAETDEFCDSFASCLALATNPQVAILIALACSCDATMPPKK